jgi:hypothetical protein
MIETLWQRLKRWFCGKVGHVAKPDTPRWDSITFPGRKTAVCKRCSSVFTEGGDK